MQNCKTNKSTNLNKYSFFCLNSNQPYINIIPNMVSIKSNTLHKKAPNNEIEKQKKQPKVRKKVDPFRIVLRCGRFRKIKPSKCYKVKILNIKIYSKTSRRRRWGEGTSSTTQDSLLTSNFRLPIYFLTCPWIQTQPNLRSGWCKNHHKTHLTRLKT